MLVVREWTSMAKTCAMLGEEHKSLTKHLLPKVFGDHKKMLGVGPATSYNFKVKDLERANVFCDLDTYKDRGQDKGIVAVILGEEDDPPPPDNITNVDNREAVIQVAGCILLCLMTLLVNAFYEFGVRPRLLSKPKIYANAETQTDREVTTSAAVQTDLRETAQESGSSSMPAPPPPVHYITEKKFPEEVLVTPYGECYHLRRNCEGVRWANRVDSRRRCKICAMGHWTPLPPSDTDG